MTALELTEYAKKYGANLQGINSCLTPIDSIFPTRNPTQEELDNRAVAVEFEKHQRETFFGFTTRELVNLDAISTRKLKPSTLHGGISYIFQAASWETDAEYWERDDLYEYTLPDGTTGVWSGHNPVVWGILQESLMIASRLIISKHVLPWFHGLMNGPRYFIPTHRIGLADRPEWDKRLLAFDKLPVGANELGVSHQRDAYLQSLLDDWEFTLGFKSDHEHPFGGKNGHQGFPDTAYGVTGRIVRPTSPSNPPVSIKDGQRISTYISAENVEPLLRDDLNDSERMGMEWFHANVLVHEIMHAIYHPISFAKPEFHLHTYKEPYFQQESVTELGFSMEYNCFGGEAEPFLKTPGTPHLGYWHMVNFPTWADLSRKSGDTKILRNPEPLSNQIRCPVPVTFYEDMHNEDFYTVGLRKFGLDILLARGKGEGVSTSIFTGGWGPDNIPSIISWDGSSKRTGHNGTPHNPDLLESLIKMDTAIGMSRNEKTIYDFGMKLIESAEKESHFWEESSDETKHVEYILKAIEDEMTESQGDVQKIDKLQWEQVDLLTEAVNAHVFAAKALIASETINSTIFTDRRHDMLNWNRGTRQYNKTLSDLDLGQTASRKREYQHQFEIVAGGLENVRMLFWVPTILDKPSQDENFEHYILGAAWTAFSTNGDFITLRNICNNVLGNVKSTWFATCLAEALRLAMLQDNDMSLDAQEVRGAGRRAIRRLKKMRDLLGGEGFHPDWRVIFDMWLGIIDPNANAQRINTTSGIKRGRDDDDDDLGNDGPGVKRLRSFQGEPMDVG